MIPYKQRRRHAQASAAPRRHLRVHLAACCRLYLLVARDCVADVLAAVSSLELMIPWHDSSVIVGVDSRGLRF